MAILMHRVLQPLNEYSENLLNYNSTFNNDLTFNITTGTGLIECNDEHYFEGGKSMKMTRYTGSGPVIFNTSSDLGFTANQTGQHILSLRILYESSSGDGPAFVVNVFRNAVLYNQYSAIYAEEVITDNWLLFAQTMQFDAGDVITFTFEFNPQFVNDTIWVDGMKFEFDDRNLGLPTAWSMPKDFCCADNDLENLIYVESPLDLPDAVSGVRTLSDKTYMFTTNIDLGGDRLVLSENTTILGTSSELASITSTGLGVGIPLITSIYSAPIQNITIKDVDTAVSFDGTTNPNDMALDWTGVNFLNVPKIGTIKKASNFIFDKGSFLNSKGIKFDGTIATVAFNNSLFSGDGLAGNIIEILPTCTITRRFRVIYSSIVATGSTVGINVDASATIPVESYILDTVNFSGGGTYLSGVTVTDNKALFVNCKGISNSSEISQYYMNANATTTVISATNTPVKVLGTTTSASITQKFTNTNNRATYTGSFTRNFIIIATLSVESSANNQVGCYIAKNGSVLSQSEVYGTTSGTGRAENVTIQTIVELSTNDYIEIYVENATAISNVLVTNLNVIVR